MLLRINLLLLSIIAGQFILGSTWAVDESLDPAIDLFASPETTESLPIGKVFDSLYDEEEELTTTTITTTPEPAVVETTPTQQEEAVENVQEIETTPEPSEFSTTTDEMSTPEEEIVAEETTTTTAQPEIEPETSEAIAEEEPTTTPGPEEAVKPEEEQTTSPGPEETVKPEEEQTTTPESTVTVTPEVDADEWWSTTSEEDGLWESEPITASPSMNATAEEQTGWWTASTPEAQWLDVEPNAPIEELMDEFLEENKNQVPIQEANENKPYQERPFQEYDDREALTDEPEGYVPPEEEEEEEPRGLDSSPQPEEPTIDQVPEEVPESPSNEPYAERPLEDGEYVWNGTHYEYRLKTQTSPEPDWINENEDEGADPWTWQPEETRTNEPEPSYEGSGEIAYNASTGEIVDYPPSTETPDPYYPEEPREGEQPYYPPPPEWEDNLERPFYQPEDDQQYREVEILDENDPPYAPQRPPTPWPKRSTSASYPMERACLQPLNNGDGPDETNSWYFDKESGECRWFAYTGYGGNANRFYSRQSCESRCIQDNTDACSGVECPSNRMVCSQVADDACLEFNRGNPDSCPPKQPVCLTRQGRGVRVAPKLREYMIPEICKQPKNPGNCTRDADQKDKISIVYYFDPEQNICHSLYFHNCGGNDNRFKTKDDCMNYCSP